RALTFILITVYLIVLLGSALLARRNLRLGRGDRRGAARVACFYFTVRLLVWLFVEHHNGLPEREFELFFLDLSGAVFTASYLWLLYVALEPFVRRRWPERIISWSRLLAGGIRDPLVGRDILIGAAFGGGMMLCSVLAYVGLRLFGRPAELALNPGSINIGAHLFIAKFVSQLSASLFLAFIPLFLLLLFVAVLRRERLALVALWLLIMSVQGLIGQVNVLMTPFVALLSLLTVFVLYRYGLLAMASAMFFLHLWVFYPMTTE